MTLPLHVIHVNMETLYYTCKQGKCTYITSKQGKCILCNTRKHRTDTKLSICSNISIVIVVTVVYVVVIVIMC